MRLASLLLVPLLVLASLAALAADPAAPPRNPALLDPSLATATAPSVYTVRFETTKGSFDVEVRRDLAPHGADRFYNLVRVGFYDGAAFFRNIRGFMVQFGLNGDPAVTAAWRQARIPDDPVVASNVRGTVSFAMSGPNSRTTQVFINRANNARLDAMGFAPFGRVVDGMDVVEALYDGYGEGAPRGRGPSQARIQAEGNAYLRARFPKLDYVVTAVILDR